jgi:hypothetical protein
MAIDTQDQDIARGSELLASVHDAITDLRREIEGLTQQAQSENNMSETAAKQSLGDAGADPDPRNGRRICCGTAPYSADRASVTCSTA